MYQFAKKSLKELKKYFIISNIFFLIGSFLDVLSPLVLKYFLDALESFDKFLAIQSLITISVLILSKNFFIYLNWYFCAKWVPKVRVYALKDAVDYVFKHSYKYFTENKVGVITRSLLTIRRVSKVLHLHRELYFKIIPKLLLSFLLAFYVNPKLAILVFALAFIFSFITNFFSKILKKHAYNLDEILNKFNGSIFDFIANFKTVRLFNKVDVFRKRFLKSYNKIFNTSILKYASLRNLRFSTRYLDAFVKIIVLIVCAFLYLEAEISLGDIAFYMATLKTFESVLQELNDYLAQYHVFNSELQVSIEAIYKDYDRDLDENLKNFCNDSNLLNLNFKQLTFAYEDKLVLKNLSLDLCSGQKVGIVGSSGSGKSTIFNLLNLLYEVPKGSIFINDQDISMLKKFDVRSLISNVSQETFVFNRSLLENLTLGKKYSENKIKNALKKACLWDLVQTFDKGLNTMVGERGVKLSGGQRQRLGIARAILIDAPIILLDEATSSLDSKTEVKIQESLNSLFKDKIVLSIAHRLSTISNMDKIIVLDKGRIIEEGTHNELLKLKGKYFKLWMHQKEINKDKNA